MAKRKFAVIPLFVCALGLIALAVFWPVGTASGQCGSQASSCKNCHEVQGLDAVNNDGTGWHQSHAFGDFCEFCHAGNVQALEQDIADTGMVAPLSDVQASCGSCHPADLLEKADVYAVALGVTVGSSSGGGTGSSSPPGGEPPANSGTGSAGFSNSSLLLPGAEVVDYSRQYDETVLGKRFLDWGDLTVGLLIAAVTLGGGGFIFWNERRLQQPSPVEKRKKDTLSHAGSDLPAVEGYPADIVAFLPKITALNPVGRRALGRILTNPEEAADLLHSLSRLDPELVQRMRALDRESRALLLALAGSGD